MERLLLPRPGDAVTVFQIVFRAMVGDKAEVCMAWTGRMLAAGLAVAATQAWGDLLVSSDFSHEVFAHDLVTGVQVGGGALVSAASGGLDQPHGILPLAHGLLVASFGTHEVLRYDRGTGAPVDAFLASPGAGLNAPVCLEIGPTDGFLYVTSQGNDRVLRFDAETGAAIDPVPFISGGALDGPSGIDWSPDGSVLYVAGRYSGNLLAYDAVTGAPAATPVVVSGLAAGSTFGLAVDQASGDIFVAEGGEVNRFTAAGALVGGITVPGLAIGVEPGPAGEFLYVAANNNLYRIALADHVVTGPLLTGSTINVLNFFHVERPDPGLVLLDRSLVPGAPGEVHYALTFSFSADAWGAEVTFQRSDNLQNWVDTGTYSVGAGGVSRNGSTDSVQVEMAVTGSTVTVTERDADPVDGTRMFRIKGE